MKKCDSRLTQLTDPTGTYQFTFDNMGRLTGATTNSAFLTNRSFTTGYDNNGNIQTKTDSTGTTTYTWDFENRLTSVTLPGTGGTVTFACDPFGRRIKKVSGAGTSIFAYDGDNLAEETNSAGAVVARYSQGLNIDEPLAMLRAGATNFYHADGLGSITSLSSSAGSIAQTYTFDSFGKLTNSSGSLTNPFRYTAREFDTETSLYYYRARYYDSSIGRFLKEDPIRFRAGIGFYTYVGNHSTDLIDPSGLLQVCCRSANLWPVALYAVVNLAAPPCHCFLKLSDGTTLGGYHNWQEWGSLGGLDLRPNDTTDHDKYARDAECSDVPGKSCENDRKARNAFDSHNKWPFLGGYGFLPQDAGTSNDAAALLLKEAGINYALPTCAWGKKWHFPAFRWNFIL